MELTDKIIPLRGLTRSGPGQRPEVSDAELVCISVAQVLLRYDDERHWVRAAPKLIGQLFPRLLGQSEYNDRVKAAAPLMEAAMRWLADATPGTAELGRLMDATPVPCGQSVVTARRSDLFGWAGYGYCPSHSRWYQGSKLLLLMCTCGGTVTGFGLANPNLLGEREQARQMLQDQPSTPNISRPALDYARHEGTAGSHLSVVSRAVDPFHAGPVAVFPQIRQSKWSQPCRVGEQVHLFHAAAIGEEDEFVAARLGVGGDLAGHLLGSGQAGHYAALDVRACEGVVGQEAAAQALFGVRPQREVGGAYQPGCPGSARVLPGLPDLGEEGAEVCHTGSAADPADAVGGHPLRGSGLMPGFGVRRSGTVSHARLRRRPCA